MSRPGPLRFSRRSLLRGLGAGTALLARPRAAMAQAAPAGNLIIFFTPNGHKTSLVFNDPTTTLCFGATAAPGGLNFGTSLVPLQPFQRDVAVIKGLNLKTPTFIASHQDICRILTCVGAPRESNDQTQFSAFGPSIDQVIGAAIKQTPLIVAVDPFRSAPHWRTFLSWTNSVNGPVNVPFVKDHQQVFTDVFGDLAAVGSWPDKKATLARIAAHDAGLLGRGFEVATLRNDLDALQARIMALPTPAPVQVDDKSANGLAAQFQTRGELWMDMIAMAFLCGRRRVAVIQWGGASEGYDPVADLGSPTHHSVEEGSAPAQHWADIDAWYASRFAYQLGALRNFGILDRTIVVWVSEVTEGDCQQNMTIVLGGGWLLGMKTGQYIEYPFTGPLVEGAGAIPVQQNPANRSLSDLWATVQQALGVNQPTFGDPKWCAGPLLELRS
jgi:hypothetical protein